MVRYVTPRRGGCDSDLAVKSFFLVLWNMEMPTVSIVRLSAGKEHVCPDQWHRKVQEMLLRCWLSWMQCYKLESGDGVKVAAPVLPFTTRAVITLPISTGLETCGHLIPQKGKYVLLWFQTQGNAGIGHLCHLDSIMLSEQVGEAQFTEYNFKCL